MSTPTSLRLPDGVRRTVIETSRGAFTVLEAMPGTGVCERQPAVLVPGYTGSKEDFLAILHQLAAAGRRVIAIDLRGQYETPGPDDWGSYAIAELGADVAAIIDAVAARVAGTTPPGADGAGPGSAGWAAVARGAASNGNRSPVHVLGHSFGGLVVRETVLAGASGIGSLTLMSSGPARLTGRAAAELAGLLAPLDGSGPDTLRRTIERVWDTQMGSQAVAAGVDHQIVSFLRERMLRNSPIGVRAMGHYLLNAPDRTAELARHVQAPVLVLYGEYDYRWEPAAQEEMAVQLSAERVCIPGAAHSPAVEAPETTASALNAFWHAAEAAADGRGRAAVREARARQRVTQDIGQP
ncbi:MAG TPA: alpha/beta hydrolase [Streptosporangiaceae bacterium]|nr:alpha/beta hydrolase [Streptosporangiaceae bacterium]